MNASIIKLVVAAAMVFTPVLATAQWKIKIQNKLNKHLHFIALLFIATSLASCQDEDPEIIDDQEVIEKELLPTYDIIETTVDAMTVVCAEELDDISTLFINRLKNENIQQTITEETELVIIDEKGATQFINDNEKYGQLENLYIRGGLIYFHKPAKLCAALVARIQLGVFNEIPEETILPIYDVYILNINGSEYNVGDVYSDGRKETTYLDENNNLHTQIIEGIEEPNEYIYGRYAENAAKFVNEVLYGEDVITRANTKSNDMLVVLKQCDNPIYLNQTYKKREHHMAHDVTLKTTGVISVIARIRCEHNFIDDSDNYHIALTEYYPGNQLWCGENKIHYTGAWYDKYGGFGLVRFGVTASLLNVGNVNLKSQDVNGQYQYKGLSLTKFASSQNNTTFEWEFSVEKPLKYSSHRARNGSVNDYSKIFTQNFTMQESWHWEVPHSSLLQDTELKMKVNTGFNINSGAATSGLGSNHDYDICSTYNFKNEFILPVPDRYKDKLTVTLSSKTTGFVKESPKDVLIANSPTLKSLYDSLERTALTRERLIYGMSKEWQKVYDELMAASPLPNLKHDLILLKLQMSDGEEITIGENKFTRIRITKSGEVSMQ